MKPAIDPCGHIAEMVHEPYVCPVRFFEDSPEVTWIRFYPVPRDRPCLPVASFIAHEPWYFDGPPKSNIHQGHPPFEIGVQYTERYGGGGKDAPAGLVFNGHYCGTESQWGGTLSIMRAEDHGIDGCCDPDKPKVEGKGGVLVGGFSVVDFVPGVLGLGGVRESGTSAVERSSAVASTGGVLEGGFSLREIPYDVYTGGVLEGGYSLQSNDLSITSEGGVYESGEATADLQAGLLSEGGTLEAGTSATASELGVVSAGGTLELGSAAAVLLPGLLSSGGVRESGGGNAVPQLGTISVGGVSERGTSTATAQLGIISSGGVREKGFSSVTFNGNVVPPIDETLPGGNSRRV